jgi:ABC-2 type transport system ATP-binding protein
MPTSSIIAIHGVSKSFGAVEVLKDFSVDILEGEIFGFLGSNGAGKSTTINILTSQIVADVGTIEISGQPVSADSNPLIGLVPQDIALYPHLSVLENLFFFAGIYGLSGQTRRRQVERVTEKMELGSVSHMAVQKLSGGWQRRLNLAVALVHQPKILILDESTVGMDVEARLKMWETIRGLKAEGTTVVLTTHLMDEAEALCHRIGILHDGRIAALGTMDELRRKVPAAQLAEVEVADSRLLQDRAKASNILTRFHAGRTLLLLPERLTLRDLIDRLAPLEIQSARLREVALGDVFLEVVSPGVV